jgi:peptide/nickel transport system substrate-binding protein
MIITILLLLSFSSISTNAAIIVSPEQTITGPKSEKIEYVRVDQPLAVDAILNGEIDAYIFNILPDAQTAVETQYSDDIELWRGISGMDNVVLNPAPAPEGQLNPFSIREVRYALNFVFDRDFLVNELMQGTAAAMYDFLGPFHPEVPSIADIKLSHGFRYDFDLANEMVENAMVLAGAEKRAGKWYYRDEPVVVKALIRVEDERRDLGDAFAADVEKLGFTIEYIHTTFGPAIDTVYGTNPADFEWSFYTEGWGIGASRWLTWQPAWWGGEWDPEFGYWLGNMPGWGNEEWWNYRSPGDRIETLGTDIYYGRYTDIDDREEKVREITDLINTEAVRIFGLRLMDAYPATTELKGLTQDVANGLRAAIWTPREAYKDDTTDLKFGNLWVWTETTVWNRYGGFNDVYSVDIGRSTYDPAVWRHPFTSTAMPFRATYEVTTEGPDGTLSVPSDAYVWDSESDTWVTVGSGVEATSKVVFDVSMFTQAKWHHGIDINMADILYTMASSWDIADDEFKSTRESTISGAAAGQLNTFKGIVVDGDQVTVYVDFYHFDDNEIAIFTNFKGGLNGIGDNPWELNAAQEDVVFEKQLAAFDQTAADVYGVPWLSLVLGEHAALVKTSLEEFLAEDYFPSNYFTLGDTTYETLDNAKARYQAAIDWYNDKEIIWISNGPFYLNRFDAEAQYAETLAYRDAAYPFKPGDWYYGRPKIPEVVDVSIPVITKGIASTIDISMAGPDTLAATYLITKEATGELVIKGEAETTATYGELTIPLEADDTDMLDIGGRYVITVLGKSPDVAFLSSSEQRFVVRDPLIVGLGEDVDQITGEIDDLSESLAAVSTDLASSIDALSTLIGTSTGSLSEDIDDVSSDIGTLSQAVSDTNENVSKLASSSNTLLYAVVATLIVALLGVAAPYLRKS